MTNQQDQSNQNLAGKQIALSNYILDNEVGINYFFFNKYLSGVENCDVFQNDDTFRDPSPIPKTHKAWSIFNIILAICSCQLLSLCFSLPALKRSCQAARHLDRGQLNAAEKNSRNALVFNLAASLLLMFGLFVSLIILFSVYLTFYQDYLLII